MSSNSRWAQSSSSSPQPPSSSAQQIRPPPQSSAAEDSFLFLSSSYNTEASNPLNTATSIPRGVGPDTSNPARSGKQSKSGYQKMPSSSSIRNPPQQSSSNAAPPASAGPTTNAALSPSSKDKQLDPSTFRSSWTSTNSDDSGKASISQSDFEFLTPSFIAIEKPPAIGGRESRGKSANGGEGGNLGVPGSKRVTGDSHVLGRMHDLDRDSAVLPPASVRGEPQTPAVIEEAIDEYYYLQQQSSEPTSATGLLSPNPLSPNSTLPLQVKKMGYLQSHGRERRQPSTVPQDVSPQPHQTQHRFYHQPPPHIEPPPKIRQQQLRHVRSDETTTSTETAKSNTTGISTGSKRDPATRVPLSSPKSQPQLTSSGTAATVTYPPTAFNDASLKRKESNSKTSGHSASPNASISLSVGGAGGANDGAVGSASTSVTGLVSGSGRARGNSASEGRHPYATSTAYRMAVSDYLDEPNSPFPDVYASPSAKEIEKGQHPYSSYRAPQQKDVSGDPYTRRSGHEGYTSDGSQSGHGSQQQYGIALGSLPPSSRPSPRQPYSKPSSNAGHGEVSDIERRYVNGLGNANEKREGLGGRDQVSKEVGGSSPGKRSKKEKRQSTATLLSLRIRNVYPVPSASNRGSAAGSSPGMMSKIIPSRLSRADEQAFEDAEEENVDLQILGFLGVVFLLLLVAGLIPLLGTIYVVVGHAILRAKATDDASSSPGSSAVGESVYLRSMISSSAKAGALGGTILALPVILLVFTAVGPVAIIQYKDKLLNWGRATFFTSFAATEDLVDEKVQQTPTSAERRRNRRASSLWGPNAASTSFQEQSTTELTINVATNVLLALLFLSLGAACAALGVTILTPSSPLAVNPYLSPTTSALAGLVGGAVVFGGVIIVGGVLAWVIYEGGKPIALNDHQLAVGSVPIQGVNVGVPIAGGARSATQSHGASTQLMSASTFTGGQSTVRSGGAANEPRWI